MQARVDVWRIDLAGLPPPGEAELASLDGTERRRHAGYLSAEAAATFARTRLALRRLIAARTRGRPRDVRLAVDGQGKPFAPDCAGFSFNVSHCPTEALVAFSDAGAVGIDIEAQSAMPLPESMGPVVCTDAELKWLRAHPGVAGMALGRLWCRKEALSKAWGTGLGHRMSAIETGDPGRTCGTVDAASMPRAVWRDLRLPTAHVAALAVASPTVSSIDVSMRSFTEVFAGDDHGR